MRVVIDSRPDRACARWLGNGGRGNQDQAGQRADLGIVGISTSTYVRNMGELIRFLDDRH